MHLSAGTRLEHSDVTARRSSQYPTHGVAGTFMRRQWLMRVGLFVVAVSVTLSAQTAQQQPTFRSGVDLIQVDVTVIDDDSRPIADLQASDFSVSIDGETRRVVQAQFVSLRPPQQDAASPHPRRRMFSTRPIPTRRAAG